MATADASAHRTELVGASTENACFPSVSSAVLPAHGMATAHAIATVDARAHGPAVVGAPFGSSGFKARSSPALHGERPSSHAGIQVKVLSLAGELLDELYLPSGFSIFQLKATLQDRQGIPGNCQRLVLAGELASKEDLPDSTLLRSLGSSLTLTLLRMHLDDSPEASEQLVLAAEAGEVRDVELLLGAPVDPNAMFSDQTGLHAATRRGHLEVVRLLLEAHANPAIPDSHGSTALHSASQFGELEMLGLLCLSCRGAGCEALDRPAAGGFTALHLAAYRGHDEVVRLLSRARAALNGKLPAGATALHCAAQNGHLEAVRALCEEGADLELVEKDGAAPLHLAAYHGHSAVVRVLCRFCAAVDHPSRSGAAPLHVAAYHAHFDTVRALIAARADCRKRRSDGRTAMDVALRRAHAVYGSRRHLEVAKFLSREHAVRRVQSMQAFMAYLGCPWCRCRGKRHAEVPMDEDPESHEAAADDDENGSSRMVFA